MKKVTLTVVIDEEEVDVVTIEDLILAVDGVRHVSIDDEEEAEEGFLESIGLGTVDEDW